MANTALKDAGLITETDRSLVIDKNKLQPERERYRNHIRQEEELFLKVVDGIHGITSFRCDHFGTTYFIAERFLHKSFWRQFGALGQFTYLGFGLGLWVSKKHIILAPKRAAPKSRGPD